MIYRILIGVIFVNEYGILVFRFEMWFRDCVVVGFDGVDVVVVVLEFIIVLEFLIVWFWFYCGIFVDLFKGIW